MDVVFNDDTEDYEDEETATVRKKDKPRRKMKEDFSLLFLYCYAYGQDTQECVELENDCLDRWVLKI